MSEYFSAAIWTLLGMACKLCDTVLQNTEASIILYSWIWVLATAYSICVRTEGDSFLPKARGVGNHNHLLYHSE